MKAMKALSVNRVLGSVRRRASPSNLGVEERHADQHLETGTPEQIARRNVLLFCESGGPNNQGEEVLYLPTIVDIAESSPAAAKECAQVIRKCISRDNATRPHMQYNGVMLMRILSDHPGKIFTSNMDTKFVSSVKELLRTSYDPSVKQILCETLENFSRSPIKDGNLVPIVEMWNREHSKMAMLQGQQDVTRMRRVEDARVLRQHTPDQFPQNERAPQTLPTPYELSTRIEEARMSAKLLMQVIQSTPPAEVMHNDLIREFADRCRYASQSLRGYMNAENPAPDNETMLTLIETDEQLALTMSKHHRAILSNRKALGLHTELSTRSEDSADAGIPTRPFADRTRVQAVVSTPSASPLAHSHDSTSAHAIPYIPSHVSDVSPLSQQRKATLFPGSPSLKLILQSGNDVAPSSSRVDHRDHDDLRTSPDHLACSAARTAQEDSVRGSSVVTVESNSSHVSQDHCADSGVILDQLRRGTPNAPVFRY